MQFSFDPSRTHGHAAPVLGEHTEVLLEQVLGLSQPEILRLRSEGVIGDAISGGL